MPGTGKSSSGNLQAHLHSNERHRQLPPQPPPRTSHITGVCGSRSLAHRCRFVSSRTGHGRPEQAIHGTTDAMSHSRHSLSDGITALRGVARTEHVHIDTEHTYCLYRTRSLQTSPASRTTCAALREPLKRLPDFRTPSGRLAVGRVGKRQRGGGRRLFESQTLPRFLSSTSGVGSNISGCSSA